ncbi:MAG TPA: TA system VapC family ribonuclease toxin [Hyphomicrobiaceae bacterium]
MRALFDVSTLLAVFDRDHVFHGKARAWWTANADGGWASCALTQNGFVRIMTQPSYPQRRSTMEAIQALRVGVGQASHEFWPDDISIADAGVFDHGRILGPNQITDVYLLGLATKRGGRVVTFDRGLPLKAVRGAEARHLVVL